MSSCYHQNPDTFLSSLPTTCRRRQHRQWLERRRPCLPSFSLLLFPLPYSPPLHLLCFLEHCLPRRRQSHLTDSIMMSTTPSSSNLYRPKHCLENEKSCHLGGVPSGVLPLFLVRPLPATRRRCWPIVARQRWGSPPLIPTMREPDRTFPKPLSPHHELHTATVGCVLWLAAGTVIAGFCSDHREHGDLLLLWP